MVVFGSTDGMPVQRVRSQLRLEEFLRERVVNVSFGHHRSVQRSVVDFVEWDILAEAEG